MSTLNGDQFRLESQIKNKPNSQGTLFRADPSQRTPESRQPRGYSPERMQAVGQALGHRYGGKIWAPPGLHEGQAQALATVARSTVPLSDIQRETQGHKLQMNVTNTIHKDYGVRPDALGNYENADSHQPVARIELLPKATKGTTPIHEIGHHVDRDRPYGSDEEKGRSEGFADAYAAKHARQPGYKRRAQPVDSEPGKWGSNDFQPSFNAAYNTERHGSPHGALQPQQFGTSKDLPKGHVPGQLPLLHKTTSGVGRYESQQTTKWDYADI